MNTVISTILICAPLAFLAGWLISKVILKQNLATKAKLAANPATPQEYDPNATIQRPDGRNLLAMALESSDTGADDCEDNTEPARDRSMSTSVRTEMSLLKEALAERDHEIFDLKANIQDQPDPAALQAVAGHYNPYETGAVTITSADSSGDKTEETTDNSSTDTETSQREELDAAKHENLLLSGQVHRAEALADKKSRHVSTWRGRARALVKQCRQQRMIIGELRNQLRQLSAKTADTELPLELPPEVHADDLKVLRGIGPALEKRLNQQGVTCYRQIAAMTHDELMQIGRSLGIGKLSSLSTEWLEQAQALVQATQPETGLEIESDAESDKASESTHDSEPVPI